MKQKIMLILLTSVVIFISATYSLAQDAPKFKVDEVVEVHSYFFNPPWHKAKILNIGTDCQYPTSPYRVRFIGEDAGDHGNPCVGGDDIRALATAENPPTDDNQPVANNPVQSRNQGTFNVGDRVDVIYSYSKDKGTRGTIIEAVDGRYKIHYDGCGDYRDAFIDREALYPAATISTDAPDIKFLTGKWAMFTPSYPNTIVSGSNVYREYGMGAKSPPLQINADGTFVWYFDYGKPPVKGKWTPHAKIEGAKYGTEVWNGVIIKDPNGGEWKVYRWKSPRDNEDHVTAQTMCSGMTMIGTRLQ